MTVVSGYPFPAIAKLGSTKYNKRDKPVTIVVEISRNVKVTFCRSTANDVVNKRPNYAAERPKGSFSDSTL
jgi:hypothetical protein